MLWLFSLSRNILIMFLNEYSSWNRIYRKPVSIAIHSPMELMQIRRRQHSTARQVRIPERRQAGRIEWFPRQRSETEMCERIRRQCGCNDRRRWNWSHAGRTDATCTAARQVRIVWMAGRSDLLLFAPLGASILEPDLPSRTDRQFANVWMSIYLYNA